MQITQPSQQSPAGDDRPVRPSVEVAPPGEAPLSAAPAEEPITPETVLPPAAAGVPAAPPEAPGVAALLPEEPPAGFPSASSTGEPVAVSPDATAHVGEAMRGSPTALEGHVAAGGDQPPVPQPLEPAVAPAPAASAPAPEPSAASGPAAPVPAPEPVTPAGTPPDIAEAAGRDAAAEAAERDRTPESGEPSGAFRRIEADARAHADEYRERHPGSAKRFEILANIAAEYAGIFHEGDNSLEQGPGGAEEAA